MKKSKYEFIFPLGSPVTNNREDISIQIIIDDLNGLQLDYKLLTADMLESTINILKKNGTSDYII
jgi:hypothetical protein